MALDDEQLERLEEMLQVLSTECGNLNEASQNFVNDQVERLHKYGKDIRLSPKQWAWLESLYSKVTL